jgi:sterol 14-demethylase
MKTRNENLLRWQWASYRAAHRDRRNLLVHAWTNPMFMAGTIAAFAAPLSHLWLLPLGAAAMGIAMALQGRTHRLEATPPAPFDGPFDVVARIFAEQWITFPRYVLGGEFGRALRGAPDRSRSSLPLPPALPGPPLVGHALQFLRDPVTLFRQGLQQKGRIFSFRLGNKNAVALLGPEHHRFFFEQTDKLLSIREAYPFFIKLFHERLYFFAEPEEYKQQRAVILPCFQGKKMANYVGVMARETIAFMDRLGAAGEFDLTPMLGPLVMNVAAAAFLGDDFRHRLGEEFFETFRAFSGGMEVVLPLWLPLPHLLRSQRAKVKVHRMLGELIAERRRNPRGPEDFLQTLVNARYADGTPIPDILIINLILVLVWAGHETTAGHVSWGLVDLLRHPNYLQSVIAEQDGILQGSADLDLDKVHRLKRMEWALKETERLNPVAFVLMRLAAEDFELSGHRVRKGSMVFVAPTIAHRLPDVFRSPDVYDPVRFGPDRAEDKVPYSLIGFGGGTHRCAGVNFAYQEMKVILTLLLQRYELELVDTNPQPVRGASTKWPESPCRVRYRLRKLSAPAAVASSPAPAGACPFHVN